MPVNECLIHTNKMIGLKRKKHVSRFTDHLRSLLLAGRKIILVNFVLVHSGELQTIFAQNYCCHGNCEF